MIKKVLITGAKGFLGRNVASYFHKLNYETYGIGNGDFEDKEDKSIDLDYWLKSEISIDKIKSINKKFDIIIHCGGSGSVEFSIKNPYQDFRKTVNGTLEVLEYMRLYNPHAKLIYPSSVAVQGEQGNKPIKEDFIGTPVSPYGYHKKITEELCRSYSETYNLKISIIRLFSMYGNGLHKQILWDAYHKIKNSNGKVVFFGTGNETRDFIHIDDALNLIQIILNNDKKFLIINGGTGKSYTINSVVNLIKTILDSNCDISFNNEVHIGNPVFYQADMTKLQELNWKPKIEFEDGLKSYIKSII